MPPTSENWIHHHFILRIFTNIQLFFRHPCPHEMASASKTLLGLGQRLTRRVPPRIAPLRCQRAYRPKNKRLSSQQEADEELPDGVQKIFTAFPCRMHYYTLTGRSKLFDGRSKHHRLITRDLPPDAVLPGEDGLVRQAVGLIWPSDPKQVWGSLLLILTTVIWEIQVQLTLVTS